MNLKNIYIFIIIGFYFANPMQGLYAQAVIAGDCINAVDACTDLGFTISPSSYGNINEFPTSHRITNPWPINPGSNNKGCLRDGEVNSTWIIINVYTSGTLEFSLGNPPASHLPNFGGCYDWILWRYDNTTCSKIVNNDLAPLRCNWNDTCNNYTGMADSLPHSRARACTFEPSMQVECGQKYILCFSNHSSVQSVVPLRFFGTAQIQCNPIQTFSLVASTDTICSGQSLELTASGAILNSYSWNSNASDTTVIRNYTHSNILVYPQPGPSDFQYIASGNNPQCGISFDAITVHVLVPLRNNYIYPDQIICFADQPDSIYGSEPPILSGGNGIYMYQWQSSHNNSSWQNITDATLSQYLPPVLIQSTYFRRLIQSGPCEDGASFVVYIEVLPLIGDNIIQSSQTICYNQTPSALSGSDPSGGNGVYTYQWQSSRHHNIWDNIAGETLQNYAPPALDSTTYFRRSVSSGPCLHFFSDTLTIWVHSLIDSNYISMHQTICSGDSATLLSGSIPLGGSGQYVYQWERAVLPDTLFAPVPGATHQNYHPGILFDTTFFRRIVIAGPCRDTSQFLFIIVHTPIALNDISAPQTICAGQTFLNLTGTLPSGGNGIFSFQWQSSQNFTLWNNLSNNTQSGLPGFTLYSNTHFRRIVYSSPCSADTSHTLTVLADSPIGNNQINSNQTICMGTAPDQFTGTIPSGGSTLYTYQWQSSTDGNLWSDISNAHDSAYASGSVILSTYYRRIVSSGPCSPHTSNAIRVTVNDTISNNLTGNSQTLCTGSVFVVLTGSFPSGGSGQYQYQWQSSPDRSVWINLPGATTGSLAPYVLTSSAYFRRIVSSIICPDAPGIPVFIEVQQAPGNNQIASSQTLCSGQTANVLSGTIPTGGNGTYAYLWETSTHQIVWSPAGNAATYAPGSPLSNTYYRRLLTSGVCPGDTGMVLSVMILPAFGNNIIGAQQTICLGDSPQILTGQIPTGGSGMYVYQWESSSTGSVWSNIPGASLSDFLPAIPTVSQYFRRFVISGQCQDYSAPVQLLVQLPVGQNTIGTSQTICAGTIPEILTGSLPSGGNGIYQYQWEQSFNNSSWTMIPGATQIQYVSPALSQSAYFRRIILSPPCAPHTSASVYLRVEFSIGNNILVPNQSICSGQSTAQIWGSSPTGGSGNYTFSWESSTDHSNWQVIFPAVITTHYTPAILFQNTYFRRRVTAGVCPANYSPADTITVFPVLSGLTISANQTVCSGSIPSPLSGSLPNGGSGIYSYIWESSINALNWTVIPGETLTGYTSGLLTATTYYRRTVQSTPCNSQTGNVISVIVHQPLVGNFIAASQTICSGQAPMILTGSLPSGGSGIYTYQWLSALNPGVWQTLSGASQMHYDPGILTQNTYFRRVSASGVCAADSSNIAVVQVSPALSGNLINASQTLCSGTSTQSLNGSAPSGGLGIYQFQWQSSPDLLSWYALSGETSSGFSPGILPGSVYFRRIVNSGSCQDFSPEVNIEITAQVGNNLISGDLQVCSGQTPLLTGTLPVGGMGNYIYLWESSVDNIVWSAITGATHQNYNTGSMTQALYFRRVVAAHPCAPLFSNVSQILILPLIGNNVTGNHQTICSGTIPLAFSGTQPSGGNGSYTYQWESAPLYSGPWLPLSDATGSGYSPSVLTDSIWYRRLVSSLTCLDSALPVSVAVNRIIMNNSIGSAQTLCQGNLPVALSGSLPSGGNHAYTYVWESSISGTVWTNITGASSQHYSVPVLFASVYFRRIVSSPPCIPNTTNPIFIRVDSLIGNNLLTSAQTLCAGQQPGIISGSVPTGGSLQYNFIWESSINAIVWATIPGEIFQDLSPPVLFQNTYYRRIVLSGICQAHTGIPVEIIVFPAIQNNGIASDQTICYGNSAGLLSGTIPSGGDGQFLYQWESSADNILWNILTGETQSGFAPGTLFSTRYYRRSVTSSACIQYGNTVRITVLPLPGNNLISNHQTICSGHTPAMMSGSIPTGSTGVFLWQWQVSPDGLSWSDIPGASQQNYTSVPLTQTVYFRRSIGALPCTTHYSDSVHLIVLPPLGNNLIVSDQTLCEGTFAQVLSGAIPSGGNQLYAYTWLSAPSMNGNWMTLPGENNSSLSPGILTVSSYFRRLVNSHTCSDTSGTLSILTNPAISNNGISNNQTLCTGSQPVLLTGTLPLGGNSGYLYQWESSSDNVSWYTLSGALSRDFQPPVLSQTVFYRRSVSSLPCPVSLSDPLVIVIEQMPGNNIIQPAQTICAGQMSGILTGTIPTGGNGLYMYQWESSQDMIVWASVPGSTQSVMLPETLHLSRYFRRVLGSGLCSAHTSQAVLIQVFAAISHNIIGNSQTLCVGDIPAQLTGSQPQGGDLQYQFQWLSSQDAHTWVTIPGEILQDYTSTALTSSLYFRRLVMSSACIDSSNILYMNVEHPPGQNIIASDQTICRGQTFEMLTGTSPSGGNMTYVFTWESSPDHVNWYIMTGENNSALPAFAPVTSGYYRRIVTSGICPASSAQSVLVSVLPGISGNSITSDQTLCAGTVPTSLSGTQPSGGNGNYTFQWMTSDHPAGPWLPYTGAVLDNWQAPVITDTLYVRRIVSSGSVCADSGNVVSLFVHPVIGNNTLIQEQTICTGNPPALLTGSLPTGGNGLYTYVWMSSDGFSSPSLITGATGVDYAPDPISITHDYYRMVFAGICPSHTSLPLRIKVDSLIGNNVIGNEQTICSGQFPLLFTGSAPSGGNSAFHYEWQYSLDGIAWNIIPGATDIDFQQGGMTQNGYFRRVVQAGVCTPHSSVAVSIWVDPPILLNFIQPAQTICTGNVSLAFTGTHPSGGNGVFQYVWESSAHGSQWNFIPGETLPDLSPQAPSDTTRYRRIVYSSQCQDISSTTTLIVQSPIGGNFIAANQTLCSGQIPAQLSGAYPTGGDGLYQYQWASSLNQIQWVSIPGSNQQNWQNGPLTDSVWFRRYIQAGVCSVDTSAEVYISVYPPLAGVGIFPDQTICAGMSIQSLHGASPSGGSGTYTFQWVSAPGTTGPWSLLTGAIDDTLSSLVLHSDAYFRRIVSSNAVCFDSGNVVSVRVNTPVMLNSISANQTICLGSLTDTLYGSIPSGGNGLFQFSWQSSPDSLQWHAMSGQTAQQLNTISLTQSHYFRRLVTSPPCPASMSNIVTIKVDMPLGENNLFADQTICSGSLPVLISGTVPSGGNATYAYTWQSAGLSGIWNIVLPLQNTQNLQPGIQIQSITVRRIVHAGVCPADTSAIILIRVDDPIGNNMIASDQTICQGLLPLPLSGTFPSGGNSIYHYQWYSSTGLPTWTFIPGATDQQEQPGILPAQSWFMRVVYAGVCPPDTSVSVELSFIPQIGDNTIFADQTICYAQQPALLTGSMPSGGNGNFGYEWQMSIDNLNWAQWGGGIFQHLNTGPMVFPLFFRRIVGSGTCIPITSNVVYVHVFPPLGNNIITGSETICSNGIPLLITGTQPTGGVGSYVYDWQSSPNGLNTWVSISGASQSSYQSGPLTTTAYFRRMLVSGNCSGSGFGNTVQITVLSVQSLGNNWVTSDQTLCMGDSPAALSGTIPTGGTGFYQYEWLSGANQNLWFTTGDTTLHYSPDIPYANTYYRRVVRSGTCREDSSSDLSIRILPLIGNNQIAGESTICSGIVPFVLSGTMPSGGNGTYQYVWLFSSDGNNWLNVQGGTGLDYQAPALTSTTYYRRMIISGPCRDSGNFVMVYVLPPLGNNIISPNQTICTGLAPFVITGIIPSGGMGQYFFYWESSMDGYNWASLPGSTYEHYNAGILNSTAYFRRHVSSGPCYISGDSSLITVFPVVGDNLISTSQTLCFGQQPGIFIGSLPSGGNGMYSYEWHYSFNQQQWFPVNGGSTSNLSMGNLFQQHYFRRIVTSGICPSDTTPILTVMVYPTLSGNWVSSDQTLCFGQSPLLLTGTPASGGAGIYQYQWLSSSGNSNVWSGISGATGIDYQPDTLQQSTCFRRFVNSNFACTDSGNLVCILIHPAITGNLILSDQSICTGFSFSTLTGTSPSGGNGQYQYQWMYSTGLQIWSPVNGALQSYLNGYTLFQNTYFKRIVNSTPCLPDTSPEIIVRVYDAPSNNFIYSDQTLCASANSFTIGGSTPAGGSGIYQYQWESSMDGMQWNSTGGIQSQTDYTGPVPLFSMYFRRKMYSNPCQELYSNSVFITLTPGISNNLIASDQTLCSGQLPALISGNIPIGATGIYTYRWESSSPNGIWLPVPGVGLPAYLPPSDSFTNLYRRIVSSDVCQDTSIYVTVLRYPSLSGHTLYPQQSICAGTQPLALSGTTLSGGSGIYQYIWESSSDQTLWTVIPGAVSDTLQVPVITATQYYRRRALSSPCPEYVSPSLKIEVTPFAGPNQISPDQTLCMGQVPVLLSGNVPSGGSGQFQFQWESTVDLVNWSPIPQASHENYQPTVSSYSVYFRRYMVSDACYSYSDMLEMKMNPIPVITLSDTTICAGDSVLLLANADLPGGIFTWNTAPFNSQSVQVHPQVTTTYAVDYILNTCFAIQAEPVVFVLPAPAAQIMTANQGNFCQGMSAQLLGLPSGFSYQWYQMPLSNVISSQQNISVSQSGTYQLRVTDSLGCHANASVIINQHPALSVSISLQAPSCSGGNDGLIQIQASGGMMPYSYAWSGGDTTSTLSGLSSGNYHLILTDAIGCVLDTFILLSQPSGLMVSDMQIVPIACNGSASGNASVIVTGGIPPYNYQWNTNPVQSNASAVNLSAGSYTVIVTDAFGCRTQAMAIVSQPGLPLQVDTRNPMPQCPGFSDILLTTVNGGTPPFTYQWSPAEYLNNAQVASPFFNIQTSTTFTLNVLDAAGCVLSQNVSVTVLEGPFARFEVIYPTTENVLRLQQSLILKNLSTQNNVSYFWDFGEEGGIDSTFEPRWQYIVTDTYRITLIVTHQNGCKDTAYQTLKYINDPIIYVPNAFSPNGDGINDFFHVAELNIRLIEIRFFDRWGNLIFISPDKDFRWDGTLNGRPLPEGVYTYYIKAFGENEEPVTISGTVTLIR